MRRSLHIAGNELRLMGADPTPVVMLLILPLFTALFLSHGFVGGPVAAIPGLSILFGFIGITAIGLVFYRDHGWGTWERLRASPTGHVEVIVGKILPLTILFLAQQMLLLAAGRLLLDMPWQGSLAAGALLIAGIVGVELGLGLLLTAFCHTINQVNAIGTSLGVLLAGLGGALAPVHSLPAPLPDIARLSPPYWALHGLHEVLVSDAGVADVGLDIVVLMTFAVVLLAVALWRLRFDEGKKFYA